MYVLQRDAASRDKLLLKLSLPLDLEHARMYSIRQPLDVLLTQGGPLLRRANPRSGDEVPPQPEREAARQGVGVGDILLPARGARGAQRRDKLVARKLRRPVDDAGAAVAAGVHVPRGECGEREDGGAGEAPVRDEQRAAPRACAPAGRRGARRREAQADADVGHGHAGQGVQRGVRDAEREQARDGRDDAVAQGGGPRVRARGRARGHEDVARRQRGAVAQRDGEVGPVAREGDDARARAEADAGAARGAQQGVDDGGGGVRDGEDLARRLDFQGDALRLEEGDDVRGGEAGQQRREQARAARVVRGEEGGRVPVERGGDVAAAAAAQADLVEGGGRGLEDGYRGRGEAGQRDGGEETGRAAADYDDGRAGGRREGEGGAGRAGGVGTAGAGAE